MYYLYTVREIGTQFRKIGIHELGEWFDFDIDSKPSPHRTRVEKMLSENFGQKDIILEIWGATTGRKYTAAKKELDGIIDNMIENGEF